MGWGPKPNSNVPIVDVPKWLWRGVSGLIGTMSLNTFVEGILNVTSIFSVHKVSYCHAAQIRPESLLGAELVRILDNPTADF